jgi:hypothetical protein
MTTTNQTTAAAPSVADMARAWAARLGTRDQDQDRNAWVALADLARDWERDHGIDLADTAPPLTRIDGSYVLPDAWDLERGDR